MGRRLALLIATYEYRDRGLRRLAAPARDAESLAAVLRNPDVAGFEVATLLNKSKDQVHRAIEDFCRQGRRDDLVVVYFTGHGLKSDAGKLFLAMADTDRTRLRSTALSAEDLDAEITGCTSKQKVLILDCCYSGAYPAGKTAKSDPAVPFPNHFRGSGMVVLTASDSTQYSFEGESLHGAAPQSVFTRHLVEGLRDGTADLDNDGDIDVGELYEYVHDRVVEEMPQQQPKRLDEVKGRIVIARNVNWKLPISLRSDFNTPTDAGLAALEDLDQLYRKGNDRVRRVVIEQIEDLAVNDSRKLSTAAKEWLQANEPQPETDEPQDVDKSQSNDTAKRIPKVSLRARSYLAMGIAAVVATAWTTTTMLGHGARSGPPAPPSTSTTAVSKQIASTILPPTCNTQKVSLTIAVSADLAYRVGQMADRFKARSVDGECIGIHVENVDSGLAEQALSKKTWATTLSTAGAPPDVWSPAGKIWLDLAKAQAAPGSFPDDAPSIVESPLTIALPAPIATALGWPAKQNLSWRTLAVWACAASPGGCPAPPDSSGVPPWQPQWGTFKLGKTDPHYSTSGLNATIGAFSAAPHTDGDLSISDIGNSGDQQYEKAIEQAVAHYGDTTLTFLANLRRATDDGAGSPPDTAKANQAAMNYISAVAVEEDAVVAYNNGWPCGGVGVTSTDANCGQRAKPTTPLRSFYPTDGTMYSDHPYIELPMDPSKKTVADAFLDWIHSPENLVMFAGDGYRAPDGTPTPGGIIDEASGAVPRLKLATPVKKLDASVLEQVLQTWPTLRKRANVLVLVDTSESMGRNGKSEKLLHQAAPSLFELNVANHAGFTDTDNVGLWRLPDGSGSNEKELVRLGQLSTPTAEGTYRDALTSELSNVHFIGSATPLYGMIDDALNSLRNDAYKGDINTIIVLSDGADHPDLSRTPRPTTFSTLKADIASTEQSDSKVRIITIAYGADSTACPTSSDSAPCGTAALSAIAQASDGAEYAADPSTIANVLTRVLSNF